MRLLTLIFLTLWPLCLLAGDPPEVILKALPEKIAGCQRDDIHPYDKVELGASAAYKTVGLLVTVYIYDLGHQNIGEALSDPILREAFESAQSELKEADHSGFYTGLEERDSGTANFGPGHQVLRARYRLTRVKGENAGQRFFSEIHVFGAKGNIVKLRISGSLANETEHAKTIEQFIPALMDSLQAGGGKK